MASAKSVFERAPAASDVSPKLSKKASKWDKPKPVPPPAVNRDPENTEETGDSELPPPAYTRNMLAKFQSLQQSDQGQATRDLDAQSSKPKLVAFSHGFVIAHQLLFNCLLYHVTVG